MKTAPSCPFEYNSTVRAVCAASYMPSRISKLRIDERGWPVPFFVQDMRDGKAVEQGSGVPDFRIMDIRKLSRCVRHELCWVCGEPLGKIKCFVAGPMCGINRVSSEPPSHYDCALFSVRACPFLTKPKMVRNEAGMPAEGTAAGVMIKRNPGVTMIWKCGEYKIFRAGDGVLFEIGKPSEVEWYSHGVKATRKEVMASVDSGYPLLIAECEKEDERVRDQAHKDLARAYQEFLPLLPTS